MFTSPQKPTNRSKGAAQGPPPAPRRLEKTASSNSAKPINHEPDFDLIDGPLPEKERSAEAQLAENAGRLLLAARQEIGASNKLGTQSRRKLRAAILKCYEAALIIDGSEAVWERAFSTFRHELQLKESQLEREDLLKLVLLYAHGKADGEARKATSLLDRALRPSFKLHRSVTEVAELLDKHGGHKGLAAANAKSRSKPPRPERAPEPAPTWGPPKAAAAKVVAVSEPAPKLKDLVGSPSDDDATSDLPGINPSIIIEGEMIDEGTDLLSQHDTVYGTLRGLIIGKGGNKYHMLIDQISVEIKIG